MRNISFSFLALVLVLLTFTCSDGNASSIPGFAELDYSKIGDQLASHFNTFLSIKSAKMAQFNDQVKQNMKYFNQLFNAQTLFGVNMLIYQFNTVTKEYSTLPPQYIDKITKDRLNSRLKVIRMNVESADLSYKDGNWDLYAVAYKDVRQQIENFRAELNVLVDKVQEKLDKLYSSRKDSVYHMAVDLVLFCGVAASKGSWFDMVRATLDFVIDVVRYIFLTGKINEAEAELEFLTYQHSQVNNLAEKLQQDYNKNYHHHNNKLKEDKVKKDATKTRAG